MKNLMLAWTLLWGSSAWAQSADSSRPGQITLSWAEFQAIWQELNALKTKKIEPPPVPPVDYTLSRARYSGRVDNGVLEVAALIDLDVLKDKAWVRVPFLPASLALKEALLDGAAAAIETKDGSHTLVTRKPGKHQISARFSLPYPKKEEAPSIRFALPMTAMTLMELEFPRPNLEVKITPSQGTRTRTVDGKTLLTAALAPSEQVLIEWQNALPSERSLPAKLYAESRELLSVGEESVAVAAAFQYNILHSAVPGVRLLIPEGLDVLAVRCPGLREWRMEEGKGRRVLSVSFNFPQKGALALELEAQAKLPPGSAAELPRIAALDVERETGAIGVEVRGPMELKAEGLKDLERVDVKELPPEIWQKAKSPLLMGFRYLKQPYAAQLAIERHQDIPVLTTAVDSANAVTLFIKEGLTVTHASYQVRNHLKQFMAFELPEGSELWSAFVHGEPVKPSRDAAGRIRIPLAKSAQSDSRDAFPVDIIYCTKAPRFSWAGYKSAVLPAPDVPVSQMLWSLYLPNRFRFLKFWGDMEMESGGFAALAANENFQNMKDRRESAFRGVLSFAKTMAVNQAASFGAAAASVEDGLAAKQADMEVDFGRKLQSAETGVLPIAFQIPASGQLYRFGKLLVVGESPRVRMVYLHARIVQLLTLLLAALLGVKAYRRRERLLALLARLNQGGQEFFKPRPQAL